MPESEYPLQVYELQTTVGGVWVDVTPDVIDGSDTQSRGMFDNNPTNRVAGSGTNALTLRNDANCIGGVADYYTPGHANAMPGIGLGGRIRVRYYYDGRWRTDMKTYIPKGGIIPKGGGLEFKSVKLVSYDYMYILATAPIEFEDVGENGTFGDLAQDVIDAEELKPEAVSFKGLVDTFATYHDIIGENVTGMAELLRGALSEMGYAYLNHGAEIDEELIIEGRDYRTNVIPLYTVPQHSRFLGRIEDENGDYPCDEDGNWILGAEQVDVTAINGLVGEPDIVTGDNFANRVIGKCYPKDVGTDTIVLFTLDNALELKAGESQVIYVTWKDPDNLATSICGKDVDTPVPNTDAFLNTLADGTGTDMSADMTITLTKDTKGGTLTITNTGLVDGYILPGLVVKGRAIKAYNPIEYHADAFDADFALNGVKAITLEQKFVTDPSKTKNFVYILSARLNKPNTNHYRSITICANDSVQHAGLLMWWDIGHRVHLQNDDYAINEDYIIQGIKTKRDGKLIYRQYFVRPLMLDTYLFWKLGIPGRSELGSTTILGFAL